MVESLGILLVILMFTYQAWCLRVAFIYLVSLIGHVVEHPLSFIDEESARAARLLGIDYAEALTGFEFKGRHGTAVLKGIVVAAEYQEAVEAVIDGFRYERQREREYERELAVLKMWRRFLAGLRIKNRVDAYASDGEASAEDIPSPSLSDREKKDESESDFQDDQNYDDNADEEGGGFFPE
jgi:xeroderma pigmentosum group C-complementing protein